MEGREGDVQSFPAPEELWKKTFDVSNQWQDNFDAVPFEDQNGAKQPRYYQELAVNKAMEAIAGGEDRILLNLATGTGKTFTMAKVIEETQRPAIILAPNKTLAAQLYGEFKNFFPSNAV